jgi:transcription elongation GreA/GreB family factor
MEKLSEVSEAMRLAIIGAEKLPEIIKLMKIAADAQDYIKAAEYKAEKDKLYSLMPGVEDLKHWKEIIDKHISNEKAS